VEGAHLQQPKPPVFVHKEIKAEELEAVWEGEEGQLIADSL
jgi:hypothetical protein